MRTPASAPPFASYASPPPTAGGGGLVGDDVGSVSDLAGSPGALTGVRSTIDRQVVFDTFTRVTELASGETLEFEINFCQEVYVLVFKGFTKRISFAFMEAIRALNIEPYSLDPPIENIYVDCAASALLVEVRKDECSKRKVKQVTLVRAPRPQTRRHRREEDSEDDEDSEDGDSGDERGSRRYAARRDRSRSRSPARKDYGRKSTRGGGLFSAVKNFVTGS